MDGNTSCLLIPTPLHSYNLSISSGISAVVETSAKAMPYLIFYGFTKNSP